MERTNPTHIWLLHVLFLDMINEDCREFCTEWNAHPMAGYQTKGRSPMVSFLVFRS